MIDRIVKAYFEGNYVVASLNLFDTRLSSRWTIDIVSFTFSTKLNAVYVSLFADLLQNE